MKNNKEAMAQFGDRRMRIASVLTRRGSSKIIATAPTFWEDLTDFLDDLCKLNKRYIKKKDFEILTLFQYVEKYPDEEISKFLRDYWKNKERGELK